MSMETTLGGLVRAHMPQLVEAWVEDQILGMGRASAVAKGELRSQCEEFLSGVTAALEAGAGQDIGTAAWRPVREFLEQVGRERTRQGFSARQSALFIYSLKPHLYELARRELPSQSVSDMVLLVSRLLDELGLFVMDAYIKTREEVIRRQQEEMMELSTPVVKIWEGILALPLVGTLDSARTQVVMETLLERIVQTNSSLAIIDITGVPTVDTLVAQHLMKTVAAAQLMGAECIISGIRPQIAQTMVHLGVSFQTVVTKASLAEAIRYAFSRLHLRIQGGQ